MIVSKSNKDPFILMRTRKTGGTSVQIGLSKYVPKNSIITGALEHDNGKVEWNYGKGMNVHSFFTDHPHPTCEQVVNFIGEDAWNASFTIGFVRNPFDIAVSRYHWDVGGKGKGETSIEGFRKWVKEYCNHKRSANDFQYPYLCIGDDIKVNYLGRYETLQDDYDTICEVLHFPKNDLGTYKGGYRNPELHWSDFYDADTEDLVRSRFKKDFEIFNYKRIIPLTWTEIGARHICIPSNISNNINGPSVIETEYGQYIMYFAHHQGTHIKLASAEEPYGPWEVRGHLPLELKNTNCKNHIASPDVHVIRRNGEDVQYVMYYHGDDIDGTGQYSYVAYAENPFHFHQVRPTKLGHFYFRVFNWQGERFAMAKKGNKCGILYKKSSLGTYNEVGELIDRMRHCTVLVEDNFLHIFYSRIGDAPEHIRACKIYLPTMETISDYPLLYPQTDDEGYQVSRGKSKAGAIYGLANQLRDPYILKTKGKYYLYYSAGGENSIKVVELTKNKFDF